MKRLTLAVLAAFLTIFTIPIVSAQNQNTKDSSAGNKSAPSGLRLNEKAADMDFACPYHKGYERPARYGAFTVRLLRGPKPEADRCHATLTSSTGTAKTVAKDWALKVDKISGADINGDGKPELVIDGYSGGERCCFTYTVVGLVGGGSVIRTMKSGAPLTFEKQEDGTVLIRGTETSLDYFLVPHSMAVVPQVLLKMRGDSLVDVGAEFQPRYDKLIEEARSGLSEADISRFRQSRYNDKLFTDQLPTVRRVLTIVLNYLYSGREDEAWRSLQELWPASDQGRVKALILQRRERGLLNQINQGNTNP